MASLGDSEERMRKRAWEGPTLPSWASWILERRVSYSPPQSTGREERRRRDLEEEGVGVNSEDANCS